MNNQTCTLLEKHFDMVFTAHDGIKKLRELILTLAMQGKLVPQDPTDQPASELLKEIEAEKLKSGLTRRREDAKRVKPEEVPYQVPVGWEWVRLGEIGFWKSGTTPSRSNSAFYGGAISWVKSGEVKQGRITSTEETITEKALSKCSLNLNPVGAVLIAMYGANIGEVGILEIEATTNQAVCACTTCSLIDNFFLLNLLMSIKSNFIGQGAGAAQPNISREKIINTIVPLPPLAEQLRIVAKINELMALCDEFEKLRNQREQKRLDVHKAALNNLLSASETNSFASSWSFITRNFGELYSVKENVAELRKAILQLAVMGKLVPQDPNDQPASELLKEIEAEKLKSGFTRRREDAKKIKPEEVPYQVPTGWEWVRAQDIMLSIADGDHLPPPKSSTGIHFLVIGDVRTGIINYTGSRFVPSEYYQSVDESRKPRKGDLLYTLVGSFGIPVLVESDNEFCVQRHIGIFKLSKSINARYLLHLYSSNAVFEQASKYATGIAQKTVPLSGLRSFLLPLPPLAEQRRIVAKIDELMVRCDELEKLRKQREQKQTALLNAIMAQVSA